MCRNWNLRQLEIYYWFCLEKRITSFFFQPELPWKFLICRFKFPVPCKILPQILHCFSSLGFRFCCLILIAAWAINKIKVYLTVHHNSRAGSFFLKRSQKWSCDFNYMVHWLKHTHGFVWIGSRSFTNYFYILWSQSVFEIKYQQKNDVIRHCIYFVWKVKGKFCRFDKLYIKSYTCEKLIFNTINSGTWFVTENAVWHRFSVDIWFRRWLEIIKCKNDFQKTRTSSNKSKGMF